MAGRAGRRDDREERLRMREVEVRGLFNVGNPMKLRFEDDAASLSQDEEWFEVHQDGKWRRLRIHDYDEVYDIPGLYEAVVYRVLKCTSPTVVVSALRDAVVLNGEAPEGLRVLDFGAGNGMEGPELQNIGVDYVVGADIIEEGRISTQRDRGWAYADYVVDDFTKLTPENEKRLRGHKLNAMTVVAALGFGDIPTKAFAKAIDVLETPAYIAFNIKEDFVQDRDESGFAEMLRELAREDVLRTHAYRRYRHRFSSSGKPLYYGAMVVTKQKEIPKRFL
jgi:hypothetical protein